MLTAEDLPHGCSESPSLVLQTGRDLQERANDSQNQAWLWHIVKEVINVQSIHPSRGQQAVGVSLYIAFAFLGIAIAVGANDPFSTAFGIVVTGVIAWFAVRLLRERIKVQGGFVYVYSLMRTRRYADVAAAEVAEGAIAVGVNGPMPALVLRDGTRVEIPEFGNYRFAEKRNHRVQRSVELINSWLGV